MDSEVHRNGNCNAKPKTKQIELIQTTLISCIPAN
jgi:hypothetical protein